MTSIVNRPAGVERELKKQKSASSRLWVIFIALTLIYAAAIVIANRRFVWYDELFTFDIARSPSLLQLWQRVLKFENHTPFFYVLSRLSMAVFGPTPWGLRFPSMVEFYLGSGAIFLYVRRKSGDIFAGIAVLLLWGSSAFRYATEARPYALVFMCFAFLLLCWDGATYHRKRRVALWGVALSATGLLAAHAFAPLSLFPFQAAEAWRSWRRRKPDYPLWAALLLPMAVMLIYIPLVRVYRGVLIPTVDQASWGQIEGFFYDSLNSVGRALFLALLALVLLPSAKETAEPGPRFSAQEFILLACMLLNPIVLNLGMMLHQGGFYYRYCITSDAAIYVALAVLLGWRLKPGAAAGWTAMGAIVLATFFAHEGSRTLKAQTSQPVRWESIQPGLPLVAANGMTFYEMNHHEDPRLLSRLYYLKDLDASIKYEHSSYSQDFEAPDEMKAAGFPISAHIESYETFVSSHPEFLVLGQESDWLLRLLQDENAKLTFLGNYSGAVPYPRTSDLYLVDLPRK